MRWMICPVCDNVQPVTNPHINYGGFEQAQCEFCDTDDGPVMVNLQEWEVTDATESEINQYKKNYE
jgi:hypothetical protein